MSAWDHFELGEPPEDRSSREMELWMQHVAGFILMEDVLGFALRDLPAGLDASTRAAAEDAARSAMYGLMMVADGVSGRLPPKTGVDRQPQLGLVRPMVQTLDVEVPVVDVCRHLRELRRGRHG